MVRLIFPQSLCAIKIGTPDIVFCFELFIYIHKNTPLVHRRKNFRRHFFHDVTEAHSILKTLQ